MNCYFNSLVGDAAFNLTKPPPDALLQSWLHGFEEDDPDKGGCPVTRTLPCKGAQCPPETRGAHSPDATGRGVLAATGMATGSPTTAVWRGERSAVW